MVNIEFLEHSSLRSMEFEVKSEVMDSNLQIIVQDWWNGIYDKGKILSTNLASNIVREPVQTLIKPFSGGGTCALYVPKIQRRKIVNIYIGKHGEDMLPVEDEQKSYGIPVTLT